MISFNRSQKSLFLSFILAASCASAQTATPQQWALLGGQSGGSDAYTAIISPSGTLTNISPSLTPTSILYSVSINPSGYGLIGGSDGSLLNSAYAATVSPSGIVTQIPFTPDGTINSVAINLSNYGLIGGNDMSSGYVAMISPVGLATQISLPSASTNINSVAINNAGQGLVGGEDVSNSYAAIVAPNGLATLVSGLPVTGNMMSVAINNFGQGLVGGTSSTNAYAASVSPSGTATAITLPGGITTGSINSVSLNDSSYGLIGGQNGSDPYVALLSPISAPTLVNLGASNGIINSVAINEFNQGLVGGIQNTNEAYAALISSSGIATTLDLSSLGTSTINSVAINEYGQGLIGGQSSTTAGYAALVSSSGAVVPLSLGLANGVIESVSLGMLSHIPTNSLRGNNLIFANYINEFAPEDAFYFIPASLDGTLKDALESAAPTRNAISLYSAINNSFYLMTNLSTHLCAQRFIHRRKYEPPAKSSIFSKTEEIKSEDELLTSFNILSKGKKKDRQYDPCEEEKHPYTIWFDVIGVLAYQKSQKQTPGFNPFGGGGILAFDAKTSENTRLGVGVSYLYTHVHEKKDAGHSNINQEDLFAYGSWTGENFYVDLAAWGGLAQIDQTRNIDMTGFTFKSSSHPSGWQALPHIEVGFNTNRAKRTQDTVLIFNPFAMCDWSNAWQSSYKEHGDSPFNAGQRSHYGSLLRTEAGIRLYTTLFFDCWNLTIQEKGSFVNVQAFNPGKVNAYLVGFPGSFTVETLNGTQNLGVGQFAFIFDPVKPYYPKIMTFYQGEFGSGYQSHQMTLEFFLTF